MACDQYSLDMSGKSFGDCKCGFAKAAHTPGKGVPHEEAWKKNAHAAPAASEEPVETGRVACDHYQVNLSGTEFGVCVCGMSKAAHTGKPRSSDLKKAPAPPPPPPAAPVEEYEPGACDHYQVDTTAAEFGTCVCGWKKGEHGKPRRKKGEPAPPEPKGELHHDRTAAPCKHYEVDVLATVFGNCKCGWSKEEHKAAGTFVEPELRDFAGGHGGDPKRPTVAPSRKPGKQDKPCSHYQVDVSAKTFGDCMCGHAKVKHAQFGGHVEEEPAVEAPPPPPPEVIVRDGQHPCVKFELDLKNSGGYGFCVCGFSRKDHEDFHQDPGEWQKVKQGLTPPKEFT